MDTFAKTPGHRTQLPSKGILKIKQRPLTQFTRLGHIASTATTLDSNQTTTEPSRQIWRGGRRHDVPPLLLVNPEPQYQQRSTRRVLSYTHRSGGNFAPVLLIGIWGVCSVAIALLASDLARGWEGWGNKAVLEGVLVVVLMGIYAFFAWRERKSSSASLLLVVVLAIIAAVVWPIRPALLPTGWEEGKMELAGESLVNSTGFECVLADGTTAMCDARWRLLDVGSGESEVVQQVVVRVDDRWTILEQTTTIAEEKWPMRRHWGIGRG